MGRLAEGQGFGRVLPPQYLGSAGDGINSLGRRYSTLLGTGATGLETSFLTGLTGDEPPYHQLQGSPAHGQFKSAKGFSQSSKIVC